MYLFAKNHIHVITVFNLIIVGFMKYQFLIFLILFITHICHSNELSISKIAPNTYIHTSYLQVEGYGMVDSNGLLVVQNKRAFIVDTPWSESDTEALLIWAQAQGFEIVGSISTHSHDDRTAGIAVLNKKQIPTYTSAKTHEILLSKNKPTATHQFTGPEFQLEGGLINAYYPGGGHTKDNIVIWLPANGILFGGCFARSVESNSLGYTGEADIADWANSAQNVLSKYPDIQVVVPGHGKVGNVEILRHTIELVKSHKQ